METRDVNLDRDHMATTQAAQRSKLSRIYIAQLLRNGTLEGFQIGRDWFVYTDSLDKFLATPRKPGPRGPRKPFTAPSIAGEQAKNGEKAASVRPISD